MDDDELEALIERLVAAARIPQAARRNDLRRELRAHFAEAGDSPDARRDALRRFGSEPLIAGSLRDVYRWDYALAYAMKVVASLIAAAGAAVIIEAAVHVWTGGFSHAIVPALTVAVTIVSVREVIRPRLTVHWMSTRSAYPWIFAAFSAAEYTIHTTRGIDFGVGRIVTAAVLLMFVWAATAAIASSVDRAFARSFETL
jgi:hypothetical protein